MRIAINISPLYSTLTGIGNYIKSLIESTEKLNSGVEFKFFSGASWVESVPVDTPNIAGSLFRRRVAKFLPGLSFVRRSFQQRAFSYGLKKQAADLYHEPNFLPFSFQGKTIVTVHDLSWIHYPQMHPLERLRMMNRYFEPGLKSASLIITDSNFVKKELEDIFGIEQSKIHAVHLGVSDSFKKVSSQQSIEFMRKYSLVHQHYFLMLGTIEPRKNIMVGIEAFKRLPKNVREKFPLVIIGTYGWNAQDVMQEINNLKPSGEVRYLGYLPEADIKLLLGSATCLIYPSFYEGFGLPVLESMASEVPVIASNGSSINEVLGDSGILIDPMDIFSLSMHMQNMAKDYELRKHYAALGKNRSQDFSWKKCAENTINVYQKALK